MCVGGGCLAGGLFIEISCVYVENEKCKPRF